MTTAHPQIGRTSCDIITVAVTSPNFAHLLRRQRLWRGWTQQELAERAGLSTRAISDLERGINEAPRLVTVRLLIQALGLADEEATALRTAALNRGTIFVGEARSGLAESSHSNLQVEEVATQHHEFGAAPPTRGEFQFEIHYARRTDGVNTAYGFVGRGPVLLLAPGLLSHLDWWQKAPRNRVFLQLLASIAP